IAQAMPRIVAEACRNDLLPSAGQKPHGAFHGRGMSGGPVSYLVNPRVGERILPEVQMKVPLRGRGQYMVLHGQINGQWTDLHFSPVGNGNRSAIGPGFRSEERRVGI